MDITDSNELKTRNSDYNYVNQPAIKKTLENFPYKKIIANWNSLDFDLKSVADADEFGTLLKQKFISNYRDKMDCLENCVSCHGGY